MPDNNVLVLGGAGYIGSHTCMALAERGYTPVVYDNLFNGHKQAVQWGPFEHGDIRDATRLQQVMLKYRPQAILHFAGLIEVGLSMTDPLAFYDNNVKGTATVLQAAMETGVDRFVFSSTCATYGMPQSIPMDETHPQAPINPYGRSKLMVEDMLADLSKLKGFRSVVLRYFNAAGADLEGRIGEWHDPESHVIPLAIQTAITRSNKPFTVFGTDYDTRDGTCIRDYIHVLDLADAHARAVDYLIAGGESVALNLGTGTGVTVKELLAAISEVSGLPFPVTYAGRREGDSPSLVADNSKARDVLGWNPQYTLHDIIRSAWNWHKDGIQKLKLS